MFFFTLFLLLVAAYFLFLAYQEWQEAHNREGAYTRAAAGTSTGTPDSQSAKGRSDSARSGSTGTSHNNDSNRNKSKAQSDSSSHKSGGGNTSGDRKQSGRSAQQTGQGNGSASHNQNKTGSSNQNNNRSGGSGSAAQSQASNRTSGSSANTSGGSSSQASNRSNQSSGTAGQSSQGSANTSRQSGTSGSSSGSWAAGGAVAAGAAGAAAYATKSSGSTNGKKASKETLRFSNRETQADDLTRINGIGPVIQKDLNEMGVYNFSQIANFSQQDIDNVNQACDFPGRIERDEWIPQARGLMQGGQSGGGKSGGQASSGGGAAVTRDSLRFSNREAQADDLQRIKGIGPVLEKDLNEIGVYNFSQIANFSQAEIDNVNTAFDFPGRIERDEWIPQARQFMQKGGGSQSAGNRGGAAAAAAGAAAVGVGAAAHSSGKKSQYDIAAVADNAAPGDFSGEIAERIKVLNMRDSDSPRLAVNKQEFNELAKGAHGGLDRGRLLDVVKILRWLCDEKI